MQLLWWRMPCCLMSNVSNSWAPASTKQFRWLKPFSDLSQNIFYIYIGGNWIQFDDWKIDYINLDNIYKFLSKILKIQIKQKSAKLWLKTFVENFNSLFVLNALNEAVFGYIYFFSIKCWYFWRKQNSIFYSNRSSKLYFHCFRKK